jgi:hypothetical protein
MTADLDLLKPPAFDVGHAHKVAIQFELDAFGVRVQTTGGNNPLEIIQVCNVVDLYTLGRHILGFAPENLPLEAGLVIVTESDGGIDQ